MQIVVKKIQGNVSHLNPVHSQRLKSSGNSIFPDFSLHKINTVYAQILHEGESDTLLIRLSQSLYEAREKVRKSGESWNRVRTRLPSLPRLHEPKKRSLLMAIGRIVSRHPEKIDRLSAHFGLWTWEHLTRWPKEVQDRVLEKEFESITSGRWKRYGHLTRIRKYASRLHETGGQYGN